MNQNRQVFLKLDYFNNRLARNPNAFPFQYGLSNLGNTCFMNSVLNCLFGDLELCQLVLNPHHFEAYSKDVQFKFIFHFANLVRASSSNHPELIEKGIKNFEKMLRLDKHALNMFPRGQQADAHEFLIYMLGRLKEQFDLVLPSLYPHQDRFVTIFDEFQVGLSQVTYCERNHRSQKYLREMISLDIKNNRTIHECLSDYFRPVNMMKCVCSSNGYGHNSRNQQCNSYSCNQCKLHVGATITLAIKYLPTILVLHLKRFRFDLSSGQVSEQFKITFDCFVGFNFVSLSLSK